MRDEWNECQGILDDGVFAPEHFADTEVAGHDAWRGCVCVCVCERERECVVLSKRDTRLTLLSISQLATTCDGI